MVWLDLGLNPGLPGQWRTLKPLGQCPLCVCVCVYIYTDIYVYIYIYIYKVKKKYIYIYIYIYILYIYIYPDVYCNCLIQFLIRYCRLLYHLSFKKFYLDFRVVNNNDHDDNKKSTRKCFLHTPKDWLVQELEDLGIRRGGGDHSNYIIIEIGYDTEEIPGELKKLAVAQISVEKHQLTLVGKNLIIIIIVVIIMIIKTQKHKIHGFFAIQTDHVVLPSWPDLVMI